MKRTAAVLSVLAFLGTCGGRPKDEEGPDDGARESQTTTAGDTEQPAPKPNV
jgi:hypothetical protein